MEQITCLGQIQTPWPGVLAYAADLDGIETGRRTLFGYVRKDNDGNYIAILSKSLSEGERRFMLARARAMSRMDALSVSGTSLHAFFDKDRRRTTKEIDELAVRLLIPEHEIRKTFRNLVIPVSTSVAKALGLPVEPVRIRLKQLGLYGLCIDAPANY